MKKEKKGTRKRISEKKPPPCSREGRRGKEIEEGKTFRNETSKPTEKESSKTKASSFVNKQNTKERKNEKISKKKTMFQGKETQKEVIGSQRT